MTDSVDLDSPKAIVLAPQVVGWYSGVSGDCVNLLRKLKARPGDRPDVEEMSDRVADAFGRRLQKWVRDLGGRQLYEGEIDPRSSTFIVAGVDSTGARIFSVDHTCLSLCCDVPGYAAIGSGATVALGEIGKFAITPDTDISAAMIAIYTAKRRAERAGGIGPDHHIQILDGREGGGYYATLFTNLEKEYQKLQRSDARARTATVARMAKMLAERDAPYRYEI